MRITTIEIEPLNLELETALTVAYGNYPVLEYGLLKVHTDTGLLGLGEASPDPEVTGETQEVVLQALEAVRKILLGADPFMLEDILRKCFEVIPHSPAAISAVDMALYDLMGKALNVPVYQLLGGKSRPGIRLYPVIPIDTPEIMAGRSAGFVQMGADVLKVKLGTTVEEDFQRLKAIQQVVGPHVRLRLDINQGWQDAATAIPAIQALTPYNIEWVEQPTLDKDLEALAEVTRSVELPIMADESCHGPEDVLKIACMQAADLINIKLMKCGGITKAREMLAIATAAGLPCILGSMAESSIGSLAGLHFLCANPSVVAAEIIGPLFVTNDPADGYIVDMQTFMAAPTDLPGLGTSLKGKPIWK